MIEELCNYTQQNNNEISLFNLKKIDKLEFKQLDFISKIETRESSRNFERIDRKEIDIESIVNLFELLTTIYSELLSSSKSLKLCFLDNNSLLDITKRLYLYDNKDFIKLPIRCEISNSSLFLQPELHDGVGVLLFLWDSEYLNNIMIDDPHQYRELIMISGFLGYLASVYGNICEFNGTVFAGAVQKEWDKIVIDSKYTPLFGYAFG